MNGSETDRAAREFRATEKQDKRRPVILMLTTQAGCSCISAACGRSIADSVGALSRGGVVEGSGYMQRQIGWKQKRTVAGHEGIEGYRTIEQQREFRATEKQGHATTGHADVEQRKRDVLASVQRR